MDTVQISRDFFDAIHKMKPEDLFSLINAEIGEELTDFLQDYAYRVAAVAKDDDALKRSFSSMLILGYLLRGKVDALRKN